MHAPGSSLFTLMSHRIRRRSKAVFTVTDLVNRSEFGTITVVRSYVVISVARGWISSTVPHTSRRRSGRRRRTDW